MAASKKIAIAIDNWKLPIFKAALTEGGFQFTKLPGVTADTLLLTVTADTSRIPSLVDIIKACQIRAAEAKN